MLEGDKLVTRRTSEMYWGMKGWTSATMNGKYVGCPELPDGSKLCMYVHAHHITFIPVHASLSSDFLDKFETFLYLISAPMTDFSSFVIEV